TIGAAVVGIVREHLEQAAADDVAAPRHGGPAIGVGYGDDDEPDIDDKIEQGRFLEHLPEIGQFKRDPENCRRSVGEWSLVQGLSPVSARPGKLAQSILILK